METVIDRRQIGTFLIRLTDFDNLDLIAEIFGRLSIIPVRAEMYFSNFDMGYDAISPAFNKIEPGLKPPFYRIDWKVKDDEIIYLQVKETRELELSGELREYD